MAVSPGRGTGHASMRSYTGQAHGGARTQDKSYEGQTLPGRQSIAGSLRLRPLSILKPIPGTCLSIISVYCNA